MVKECYYISLNINTPYSDVLDMSSREKNLLIKFINEKHKAEKDAIEKAKKKK